MTLLRPDDFDPVWYLKAYPDVAAAGIDPQEHFTCHGLGEGRFPRALKAVALDLDLWRGFEASAEPALEELVDGEDATEAALAAWHLARWYVAFEQWGEARRMIERLQSRAGSAQWTPPLAVDLAAIEALLKTGALSQARLLLADALARRGALRNLTLAHLNLELAEGASFAILGSLLNALYQDTGFDAPSVMEGSGQLLDRLGPSAASSARRNEGNASEPLVTVIVPVYNAAATIDTALRGLVAQSWRNLEILVVDDGSSDETPRLLRRWCRLDRRIRVLRIAANSGAYIARNLGFAEATGSFVTVHDADDWSHPEKVRAQAEALIADPDAQATISHWVRVTSNLEATTWRFEADYIYRNISSLMVRASLRDALGYWDRVRVNADTEYFHRLTKAFGPAAIRDVHPGVPLSFGRTAPGSLTQRPETHLRTQFRGMRRDYQDAAARWHERAAARGELYLPQIPARRPFAVPPRIGVGDPEAELTTDEIIRRSDFFDAHWYLGHNDSVRGEGICPALHYVRHGAAEGRDPGPRFSTSGYALAHDCGAANPLLHWELSGWKQGFDTLPVFPGAMTATGKTVLVFGHAAGEALSGAERGLLDMLDRFCADGECPVVVLPHIHNAAYLTALQARSVAVHIVPMPWWRFGRAVHAETLEVLTTLMRRLRPAAVRVNTLMLHAPLLAARRLRIATTVYVRELPPGDPDLCRTLGLSADMIRGTLLEQADSFVANSPMVARWLGCPQRTRIVYERSAKALFDLPFAPGETLRFALISSNIFKKGIAEAAELGRRLEARGVSARILLIGPGTPELASLGPLPRTVEAPGYCAHSEDAHAQADVVLSLSHFAESFGRTVLEAMAAGRPVICFARGFPQEIVRDGETGFVVPADDIDAVADAAARFIVSRDLLYRMSAAARLRARGLQAADAIST